MRKLSDAIQCLRASSRRAFVPAACLLSLAAHPPAHANDAACPFDPTPINESYQIMLGREATAAESEHFAGIVGDGIQFAYDEPYLTAGPTGGSCNSWIGRVVSPAEAGIPWHNDAEWAARRKDRGKNVTAIYRTLCQAPQVNGANRPVAGSPFDLWTQSTTVPLTDVAKALRRSMPAGSTGCWNVVNEIFKRELGRKVRPDEQAGCAFNSPNPPSSGTACSWFWNLANGEANVFDVAHQVRGTPEYIQRNQTLACQNSVGLAQSDPHSIGEYVNLLYRLYLARFPSKDEVSLQIKGFAGGDTRPLLQSIKGSLTASAEYARLWGRNCSPLADSLVFNYAYYVGHYPDLSKLTLPQAVNHWITNGIREGRQGRAGFYAYDYLALYPDLRAAFGPANYTSAVQHYVTSGDRENRLATTALHPAAFNADWYVTHQGDLSASGFNDEAGAEHWLNYGISPVEGRQGAPGFSARAYLNRYGDVRATCGSTGFSCAIRHYVLHGIAEGRSGL